MMIQKSIRLFLVLSCLTLVLPNSAYSESPRETYVPLTELTRLQPTQKEGLEPLSKASFSADFMTSNDNKFHCTATFISEQGHFITAAHCLKGCVSIEKKFRPTEEMSETFKDGLKWINYKLKAPNGKTYYQQEYFSDRATRESILYERYYPQVVPLYCKLQVNGSTAMAQLLVTGYGELHPYNSNEPKFKEIKNEMLRKIFLTFESQGAGWPASDYAVLKIIGNKKTNCVQLGNRWPSEGEKLKTITYTLKAAQGNPDNEYLGRVAFYADGIPATSDMFQNKYGDSKYAFSGRNNIVTNVDANTGSSGGGVIGSDGTVLGLFSLVKDKDDSWGPRVNVSILSGVLGIRESILQSLGREINCK